MKLKNVVSATESPQPCLLNWRRASGVVTARSTGLSRELRILRWENYRQNQGIGVSLFARVSDLFSTSGESNGSKPGHVAQGLGNRLSAITMDEFSEYAHHFTHFIEKQ